MKKNICKSILYLTLLSFSSVSFAAAMVVFDPKAYINAGIQLEQLKNETQVLEASIKRLGQSQYEWSNAQDLLKDLGTKITTAGGIAYSTEKLDQEFKKSYPGYVSPDNYSEQYSDNVNRTQKTLGGTLQSMNHSAAQFEQENIRLQNLQLNVEHAEGQTQAIQASAQIASEVVSQIQLLRQAVMAQSSAQTAYYAQQVQAEASSQAMLAEVVGAGNTEVPEYGSSGNYLTVPDF